MKLSKFSPKKPLLWVVLVIVLIALVVFGLGRSNNDKGKVTTKKPVSDSSSSAHFRSSLVSLGVEHVDLLSKVVNAELNNSKDASDYKNALYKNGTDISTSFGNYYSKDTEGAFSKAWQAQIDGYIAYTEAVRTGNKSGQNSAFDSIDRNFTQNLSAALSKDNPKLGNGTLKSILGDQVAMNINMINLQKQGKTKIEIEQLRESGQHIAYFFDTVVDATVKQYPSKF
jgi:hypothetical protein